MKQNYTLDEISEERELFNSVIVKSDMLTQLI